MSLRSSVSSSRYLIALTALVTATSLLGCGAYSDGRIDDEPDVSEAALVTATSKTIAAGGRFGCAITGQGGVKCWGANDHGQLGDGTQTDRPALGDVVTLTSGVKAIVAADESACALTAAGGVKCWGDDAFGQLGDGSRGLRSTPVDVVGLTSGVRSVVVGRMHSCAITTSGALKCWGYNRMGQLGDGTTTDRYTPVDVVGLGSGVKAVAVSGQRTCALLNSGGVKCWGAVSAMAAAEGGLGAELPSPPPVDAKQLTPVAVPSLASGVAAIAGSASGNVICALKSGAVQCWGTQRNQQIDGGWDGPRMAPVSSGPTSGVVGLSVSDATCALTQNGKIQCWGDNEFGQRGDGTWGAGFDPVPGGEPITGNSAPGTVSGISNAKEISCGKLTACARLKSGGVECWGVVPVGTFKKVSTPESLVGL